MKRIGLAAKIREAMRTLGSGGREVTNSALAEELGMVFDNEKRVLYRALRDFRRSGETTRIRRGVYIYNGRNKPPQLQEIMWRFLRARKVVTIDDLREISGASKNYAMEWMRMLQKHELVKVIRTGNLRKYQLISDQVAVPQNDEKAKKFRRIRRQKKSEALVALQGAEDAISRAREAVEEIEA